MAVALRFSAVCRAGQAQGLLSGRAVVARVVAVPVMRLVMVLVAADADGRLGG
jgi:hypothetical protein